MHNVNVLSHSVARLPCPSLSPRVCSNSCPFWVGDAIQPSHPLLSPSPFALNLSQHQDLFQWVGSSNQVASFSFMSYSLQSHGLYARQAPLSMEFSRQEYWSGLPYPSLEDLPNPGIEPGPPALHTEILGSVFFPQLVREIKNLNV